jgi:hypothetical protein
MFSIAGECSLVLMPVVNDMPLLFRVVAGSISNGRTRKHKCVNNQDHRYRSLYITLSYKYSRANLRHLC